MFVTATPSKWRPLDIEDLEPNAWKALQREGSTLVVAGPGAGKTEFLAQRAAYLLQTRLCPPPFRILAISFKVDAAKNLQRRVEARSTAGDARRFVSLTFDAFTKSIVDRFLLALPQAWRPSMPYDVYIPLRGVIAGILQMSLNGAHPSWQTQIAALQEGTFEARVIGQTRLHPDRPNPENGREFAVEKWWKETLDGEPSALTFTCLNRLAELVMRSNPQIRRAFLATYPLVFIDEFQDTTHAQYDFLESVFSERHTVVTAVGDDKQRIMSWAGAKPDVFTAFKGDFQAEQIPLLTNFRSSPDLVHLQTIVGRAIDPAAPQTESQVLGEIDGNVAEVWKFQSDHIEASNIAAWLKDDMAARGKAPRDYALLVRQKADDYGAQLRHAFDERGLRIRNESHTLGRMTLQDLLSEDFTSLALSLLKLAVQRRAPQSWAAINQALPNLRAFDPEDDISQTNAQDKLTTYIADLRREFVGIPNKTTAAKLVDSLFRFLDVRALRGAYPRYADGDQLEIAMDAFSIHLSHCAAETKDWAECLDLFEGTGSIPLMTIHKSKGLEYDTIVFMGLDDQSWWSHRPGNVEGRATFLVALSRAKQRVIFTYCESRAPRDKVVDLYELLTEAGVPEKVIS